MIWRVIPLEARDAFTNLATDEAIMESVANGGQPTIRFYRWKPSALSMGFFQSLQDIDMQKLKEVGADLVRRQTGGGIVYHGGDISYSLVAPEMIFPQNIAESYQLICSKVLDSLKILGVNAEPKLNEIAIDGKLISSNAQTRRNGVLFQHGTVFYDSTMPSFLKIKPVTNLLNLGNFDIQTVYHAMVRGFTSDKEFVFGHKTNEETERMRILISEKYSKHEWLARR